MTVTIDLSPTEEAQLTQEAERAGLDTAGLVKQLVTQHLAPIAGDQDPTLQLFAQWEKEDAQMTSEEIAQEQKLWSEFERNTNETREQLGMRQL
ncbi:hypothetical protein CCAX7_18850 [Capsulimonas corticalis]|uniref:Uncharacterized protein n=2 Tax=Capsulimonas corticalis TaxID=2219043 RepID=A0A402D5J7_9BACT|nr:hypothetical protein CCAX7_18850 [Capsulimonas corticalis]